MQIKTRLGSDGRIVLPAVVRRALARRLAKRRGEPAWASFAGAVEDGDPDASTSVDTVVYGRETP